MTPAAASLLTFAGLALLLGGALARRRLAGLVGALPGGWPGWQGAGALLIALGVALHVGGTLTALGFTAPADVLAYLTSTVPGRAALTTLLGAAVLLTGEGWGRSTVPVGLGAAVTLWGVGGDLPMRAAHALHAGAMAAWTGGVLVLSCGRGTNWRAAARAFTPVALGGVVLLSLTGLFMGLHHAGPAQAWPGSGYGTTLLLKLGVFAATLVTAVGVRRTLAPHTASFPRAALMVEAGLLLAVLGVTAVLVGSVPPRT
ncbi:CopD family protein [Deinococcus planocerae]|uniref:CopD family protein n=1 Tax=Deinococcus planocerae TaxID=1737569 RepID=UPI000C7F5293|nr:CopD family protein [Deinococcus planocerae]